MPLKRCFSPRKYRRFRGLSVEMKFSRERTRRERRIRRYPIRVCSYRSLSANGTKSRRPSFPAYLSPIRVAFSSVKPRTRIARWCAEVGWGVFRGRIHPVGGSKNHFHVHGCPHYGYMHRPAWMGAVFETEVISYERRIGQK